MINFLAIGAKINEGP